MQSIKQTNAMLTCGLLVIVTLLNGCATVSYPSRLIKSRDDGFILLDSRSNDASVEAVVKLNPDAKQEWRIDFSEDVKYSPGGYSFAKDDNIDGAIEIRNGGYVLLGSTNFENKVKKQSMTRSTSWDVPLLVKLDANGKLVWRKDYSSISGAFWHGLELLNSDMVVGGLRVLDYDRFKYNGLLARYDLNGNMRWSRELPEVDRIDAMLRALDGAILIFGDASEGAPGFERPFAAKISLSGEIQWQAYYDIGDAAVIVYKAIAAEDGGAIVAGSISAGTWENHMFIAWIDKEGALRWKKFDKFDDTPTFSFGPEISDLCQLPTGDILVLGTAEYGFPKGFISKISPTGKKLWTQATIKDGERYRFQKIQLNPDGTIKLIGTLEKGRQRNQIHSITVSPDGAMLTTR